jgi:HEAT repeat protein
VSAHLTLEDARSAIDEAKSGLKEMPDSKPLQVALIRALCAGGDEIEALEEWKKSEVDLASDRTALETLAWGVLNKGEKSNQLNIRAIALLGAALTRDAKALPLIMRELRGSNAHLRSLAVTLAATFGDLPLQEELAHLLKEEKVWYVRLELLKAAGQLRMTAAKETLKLIVGHPHTLAEEKVAAIVALVNMYEAIDEEEFQSLMRSNRAGLRELSCEVISHLELEDRVDDLLVLLNDSHPSVRLSAVNALTFLLPKEVGGEAVLACREIWKHLDDRAPEVSIATARLHLIYGGKEGRDRLQKWALDGRPEWRRLATAAIATSGRAGVPLSKEILKKSPDQYMRVNLALGLIGQREEVEMACRLIAETLKENEESLLMWDSGKSPALRSLAPSEVRHIPQVPNYPIAVDQKVRLELLSVLCQMKYPKAEEAVKSFLQSHSWGITGAAAGTLLSEGDEESLDIVRMLLNDKEEKVRLQAALILTMLGRDPEAIQTLKKIYVTSDREVKIRIIEALASAHDPETIPFLLEILHEPFQMLRVVAASAIIQCLYR